jgi:hypothetical protein
MPSWIADSGLCLLAQKTRYVARHIRLRSRALSGLGCRSLLAIFQFPFRHSGDRFDFHGDWFLAQYHSEFRRN